MLRGCVPSELLKLVVTFLEKKKKSKEKSLFNKTTI